MALESEERWRLVERLFYQVLDYAPAERTARLAVLCGGDNQLLEEVESLLSAADAAEVAAAAAAGPLPDAGLERDPWIGQTLGNFRLERLIGRGGMGAVYLGRRMQGDFEQRVACKVVPARFSSSWLRERFLEERQVLASLSHAHIARLLDGGFTLQGAPYLVMEYVDGVPLDRFCEEQDLPVVGIVRLFLRLCEAVSFAHRHFIIHRDLKPANVLVTADGQLKLLDFGSAKLLIPDPSVQQGLTWPGLRAFTPSYASPEVMAGEPITTAADVYSLGVILYRLLSGRLPFASAGLSGAGTAAAAARAEPLPPHMVITRHALGGPARDKRAVRRQVRGDLDAIVLKALCADVDERYASVDALASDLRSFLEHRPVEVRRSSLKYRAGKFVRAHAVTVAAALVIAAVFASGMAAIRWQANAARQEEQQALAGYQSIRHLASLLLFDFYDQVKQLPGSTPVQRRLATEALAYLDRLSRSAGRDPDLELDLAEAYTRMGNVLGNPYDENLGDAPRAAASLEKAVQLAESVQRLRPADPLALRRLSLARRSLAEVQFSTGNTASAIEGSRAAAQSFEALALRPDATLADIQEAASTFDSVGDLYGLRASASTGDLRAALESYCRSLALHRRARALAPANIRSARGIAILQMKIADCQRAAEPAVAAQGYLDALSNLGRLPEEARQVVPTVRAVAIISRKLAGTYADMGLARDAIPYLDSARKLWIGQAERDPEDARTRFDLATIDYDLGEAHERIADPAGARPSYEEALQFLNQLLRRNPANLVWQGHRADVLYRLGWIDRELGRQFEGEQALQEALEIAGRVAEQDQPAAGDLDRAALYLLEVEPASLQDPAKALTYAIRAVDASHGANPEFLITLAKARKACGQTTEARLAIQQAMALFPPSKSGQNRNELRRSAENVWNSLSPRH